MLAVILASGITFLSATLTGSHTKEKKKKILGLITDKNSGYPIRTAMPALSVTLLQPNLLNALFKKSVNVIIIIKWVTIRNTLYQILFSSQAAVKLNDLPTGSATIQFFFY